jgi:DNA-directed RNA polymerase I, II, and III subunit RPABC1
MSSINIEYNSKEINQIIIMNILKMLYRRKLIESYDDEYAKLKFDNNTIIEINLNNNKICSIYFLNIKLTTITQNTPLDEYLSDNDNLKIVIAKETTKKVVKQILTDYKNAEFFFEHEMMEDIPSKHFIPEHQLLDIDEKKELLNKFSEYELSRIVVTDMMSRYYGAKIGDIFKIIRPSFTAGKSIFYRRVVNGSIDILF